MTQGADPAALWWSVPPAGQVSYLVGADPELLSIGLDPLPPTAPAVIQFRPAIGGHLGDQVTVLLAELDRVAIALFPRWLPGAEQLDGSHPLSVRAVRDLAAAAAARSRNFGPFLKDLAERGLRSWSAGVVDHRPRGRSPFLAEVRAAGLARVIADAYGRESTALLITVAEDLSPADERALVAAAEWLAQHGRLAVWLAGAPLHVVDRVRSVAITLPAYLNQLAAEVDQSAEPVGQAEETDQPESPSLLTFPPLSGVPRRDSAAEQKLERALEPHDWAQGRQWNRTFERHILAKPYRLDLFWPVEGLVVEVDGPEHRGQGKYADDRHRDVQLQLLGFDVFRFTNEQVLSDVQTAVQKIKQLLTQRRADHPHHTEMRQHVDH